jgi:hypothetical protein
MLRLKKVSFTPTFRLGSAAPRLTARAAKTGNHFLNGFLARHSNHAASQREKIKNH